MDGVDGKLSRVKKSSSNIGKIEHAFDFLFEHSWYMALALYLSNTHGITAITLSTLIILFDGFFNFCDQAFRNAFGEVQLVDYEKLERTFRKFDGRRNTYIIFIVIGVLLKVPFYSLVAITFLSFMSSSFYCLRAMKHLHAKDSQGKIVEEKKVRKDSV
jgi:phosphatidylglycerophosphate synthase